MLRGGAPRVLLRCLKTPASAPVRRSPHATVSPVQWRSQICTTSSKRPQSVVLSQLRPSQASILTRSVTNTPWDKIDKKAEDKIAHQEIKATPETVSAGSSVHPIMHEIGTPNPDRDVDMMAGIKHDVKIVGETFSLKAVPKEAFYIGLAGVLPYLATSLSTVFCAWEINNTTANGAGFLISHNTAEALIHILEPLQVGYGAVIISFLGAIHWGLEFAGYGGTHGYKRYAIGVVAPAVAWPTLLMPVESALITQFLAFTMLYYVDTRAAYRGWVPSWYSIYRFVLTFIVGTSIVVSLVGRGEVANRVNTLPGGTNRIAALRQATLLGEEDEEKFIEHKAEEEEEEEEGGEESEDKGKSGEDEQKEAKDEANTDHKKDDKSEDKSDEKSDEGKKETHEDQPQDQKDDQKAGKDSK